MESSERKRNHILELDGVRGVAILLVLWGHLKIPVLSVNAPIWFHSGVDLFFVLSGFLITRILLYNRDQGVSLREFYKRRVARILPPAVLTVVVVSYFWPSHWNGWAAVYLLNIRSMIEPLDKAIPINHFWSLCVEEQFYLLFPFLVLAVSARSGIRICIAGCLICIGLMFAGPYAIALMGLSEETAANPWIRIQLWTRGWMLILGAVFAYGEPWIRRNPKSMLFATIGLPASALGLYMATKSVKAYPISIITITNQIAITSIFTYALWASLSNSKSFFTDRVLMWCGKISYGLYLYHFPIYYAVRKFKVYHIEAVVISVGLSFVVATISFYLMEQPIIRLARKSKLKLKTTVEIPQTELKQGVQIENANKAA